MKGECCEGGPIKLFCRLCEKSPSYYAKSDDPLPPTEALFDVVDDEYPIDAAAKAHTMPAETKNRIHRQERRMLEMFLTHDLVSNAMLSEIGLKYFTCVSNLRGVGYDIQLVDENKETGLVWYRLASPIPRLKTYRVAVTVRMPGCPDRELTLTVEAISATSARFRAWRMVKVIAVSKPEEVNEPTPPASPVLDGVEL